jgi:membrane associated rhomboid family serine protease
MDRYDRGARPPAGERHGGPPGGHPRDRSALLDRRNGLLFIGAMALLMWVVEVVNAADDYRLDSGGIRPRAVDGLDGVVFAPFLHASWSHLIGNTVPFLVLGAVIALSGLVRVLLVTLLVAGIAGIGTWLVAPSNTVHVGASGVVFGYAGYLVARGFFSRSLLHLGTGAVVAVIWGTTLVSGLVPRDGISWQGHLFGAIGGIVAASLLSPRPAERRSAAPEDPLDAYSRSSVASMRP